MPPYALEYGLPAPGAVKTAAPGEMEIPVVETAAENLQGPAEKSARGRPALLAFTEGLTASYLTRIIRQENRSNFVFEDYLAGLFFNVKTRPWSPVNIMARFSAYYPLLFYFNDIPQPSANPIHYGADLFLGPVFEPHIKNLIRFNLSPGLHIFFENTDRWNYLHLGAAALAGIELPLTTRWTIYLDGLASLDYGNLGNNRTMEPYDIVYQYQLGLGLRYSKKNPNVRPWIRPRQKINPPKAQRPDSYESVVLFSGLPGIQCQPGRR
jgi:hypothetical protein